MGSKKASSIISADSSRDSCSCGRVSVCLVLGGHLPFPQDLELGLCRLLFVPFAVNAIDGVANPRDGFGSSNLPPFLLCIEIVAEHIRIDGAIGANSYDGGK